MIITLNESRIEDLAHSQEDTIGLDIDATMDAYDIAREDAIRAALPEVEVGWAPWDAARAYSLDWEDAEYDPDYEAEVCVEIEHIHIDLINDGSFYVEVSP